MNITHEDAMAFLLQHKRENERLARDAKERGNVDHAAEARILQYQAVADLLEDYRQKIG